MGTMRRLDWIWAGSLLVVSAALPFVQPQSMPSPVALAARLLSDGAFAAAMVLFALGSHSVVARRGLGVTALLLLAATAFLPYAWYLMPGAGATMPADDVIFWGTVIGYLHMALTLAAAIVACVQVARAGAVPGRLRWAPLVALVVGVVPFVLVQIVAVASVSYTDQTVLVSLFAAQSLTSFVALAGLGVVAIVAGLPARAVGETSVPVFSSLEPPRSEDPPGS